MQSEAELCAIFKKKDYENKRGSQSFNDVLIILLACVSKTTIHLLWRQKETQKSDLKFLELPQTLLFISQYCDSFVILLLLEMGRQGIKKLSCEILLLHSVSDTIRAGSVKVTKMNLFFPFESQSDQHQFTPNSVNT